MGSQKLEPNFVPVDHESQRLFMLKIEQSTLDRKLTQMHLKNERASYNGNGNVVAATKTHQSIYFTYDQDIQAIALIQ